MTFVYKQMLAFFLAVSHMPLLLWHVLNVMNQQALTNGIQSKQNLLSAVYPIFALLEISCVFKAKMYKFNDIHTFHSNNEKWKIYVCKINMRSTKWICTPFYTLYEQNEAEYIKQKTFFKYIQVLFIFLQIVMRHHNIFKQKKIHCRWAWNVSSETLTNFY